MNRRDRFVPCTPAGTFLVELARRTEEKAWRALEAATRHMPYPDRNALKARGYEVWEVDDSGRKP